MVVSFASLLVEGCSPWESRYLLYCLDSNVSCSETLDGLDVWLAWSFTELMSGHWFEHGPFAARLPERRALAGKPIASGFRGIIVAHRGDEKHIQKAYHMSVSWISEQVCWRCCASRVRTSELLYTYFGPAAPHRNTMISLETFLTETCRPNAWVNIPGFHPEQLLFDFLHVFDLTLVPDAAASAT